MSSERRRTSVPDVSLERYLLSELPEREMAEMKQRLDQDEDLRARLETLRRSNREILERYPAQSMGRQIETKLNERKRARPSREPLQRRWLVSGVLAAAAIVILLTLPVSLLLDRGTERTSPTERVKGLEPRLILFRNTAGGSERLEDGAAARPGDLIRIAYQALDQSYGVILSVDGSGTITRHLPEQGERAIPLQKDGLTLLQSSYELDDAPSWERFYFVTADAPFDLAPVIRAARQHRARPSRWTTGTTCTTGEPEPIRSFSRERYTAMSVQRMVLTSILVFILFPGDVALAMNTVHRFALSAGANDGGPGRPALRYAVSDAESFAHVMTTLGGVEDDDLVLLKQPSLYELEEALDQLRAQVDSLKGQEDTDPVRTEIVLYFSGHANDTGLLLGRETFSYQSLRNWMELVDADVRIAVLDACDSGTITRLKGGRRRKPFLVDASSNMRGHAFLTSSSADEAAQESDGIGASFFTHYLVSGLRGAADTSGDGRVTLNEAYEFAFNETLGQTTATQAGAQHPAYDINLSGTGEVVMTDLRQTSSTLVLEKGLGGRFYIRNAKDQLVVELYKPYGRNIELGLEPGNYKVRCDVEARVLVSAAELEEGGTVTLRPSDFTATDAQPVTVRGGAPAGAPAGDLPFGGLNGRHRIGFSFGIWHHGGLRSNSLGNFQSVYGPGGSFGYAHWFRENLAFTLDFSGHAVSVESGLSQRATAIASSLVGIRYYPLTSMQVRPYLSAGMGPFFVAGAVNGISSIDTVTTAIGGRLGGGLDAQVARSFMIGGRLGYNILSSLSGPVVDGGSFNGWEVGIELGWVFGKGRSSGESRSETP